MPELPEVETTRTGIAPYVEGRFIKRVIVRTPRLRYPVPVDLAKKVNHQTIKQVARRGKYLLLILRNGTVLIHLGMSGSLRMVQKDLPPGKHDHVDMIMDDGLCLRYTDPRKFGAVLWVAGDVYEHPLLKHLGPEPLDESFNANYLCSIAQKRSVAVKLLLMNSHVVVGMGNIYANEALFLAGIDPRSASSSLAVEACKRIVKSVKQVLRKAIEAGGTTLRDFVNGEGKPGYFQQELYVYGRSDEPCRRCGQMVEGFRLGQRSTYCCPRCQVMLS